jgi:hypothetical protein
MHAPRLPSPACRPRRKSLRILIIRFESESRFASAGFIFQNGVRIANAPPVRWLYYITVDGQTPAAFRMDAPQPNIEAQQGTVEDWVVENRATHKIGNLKE